MLQAFAAEVLETIHRSASQNLNLSPAARVVVPAPVQGDVSRGGEAKVIKVSRKRKAKQPHINECFSAQRIVTVPTVTSARVSKVPSATSFAKPKLSEKKNKVAVKHSKEKKVAQKSIKANDINLKDWKSSTSNSGYKGVYKQPDGRFEAYITMQIEVSFTQQSMASEPLSKLWFQQSLYTISNYMMLYLQQPFTAHISVGHIINSHTKRVLTRTSLSNPGKEKSAEKPREIRIR